MKKCPNCQNEVQSDHDICWSCSYDFDTDLTPGFIDMDKTKGTRKLDCLRCKTPMKAITEKDLEQSIFKQSNPLINNLNIFDLYLCPICNKIEFFNFNY